jgi:uncharacterized protein (TIGR03118 family)
MTTLLSSKRLLLTCATLVLAPGLAFSQYGDPNGYGGTDASGIDAGAGAGGGGGGTATAEGTTGGYEARVLVSDGAVPADFMDPNLVNGWGVAFNPQAFVWIADAGTGKATVYDGAGQPNSLVVTMPPGPGETAASPTGIVFSGGEDFVVTGTAADGTAATGPARFIFVTEAGQIVGWSPNVNPAMAFVAVDNSAGGAAGHAIYKGATLGGDGASHLLYVTDFHNARIDVFDGNFQAVTLASDAFVDASLPAGFAPFGIQAINGDIYVTYAMQDESAEDDVAGQGLGFVDVFDPKGTLVKRLVQGPALNAPWGLALAPLSFGQFGGALLVGNFGDGAINAFSPTTGEMVGTLSDANGMPIRIEGLWGMQFGNGLLGQETNVLFAAAGPSDEQHGTYNMIRAQ